MDIKNLKRVIDDLQTLRDEGQSKLEEAARLEKLIEQYPDLRREEGRWKKVVYSSPSVNSIVDSVELRHNCGCCGDSPLEAWFYTETESGRVYSSPSHFQVGEKWYVCEDRPYTKWKESVTRAGISARAIEIVQGHFDKCLADGLKEAAEDPESDAAEFGAENMKREFEI